LGQVDDFHAGEELDAGNCIVHGVSFKSLRIP
jgi:hypothetical protein